MLKPDGVVVLYNPDDSVLSNLQSYIEYVDLLYVVDNSEKKNVILTEKIKRIDNAIYIDNEGNLGIASALNIGAKEALANGASWLLTMDQDSQFDVESLQKLIVFGDSLPEGHRVGILSPLHKTVNFIQPLNKNIILTLDVDSVMTSGNLINLEAFKLVGGFLEKYFIDCVDHEFCLRLKKNNFRIISCQDCFLYHHLGDIEYFSLFGKKIYYTNHSSTRRYYMTRNRLDLILKYGIEFPSFSFKEIKSLLIEWLKIIFFEKNKVKKTVYILKGCKDCILRRFGKL